MPTVLEANLALPEHFLRRGNFICWQGTGQEETGETDENGKKTTKEISWNCPAELVDFNPKRRLFRIRSLDNGLLQNQWFPFVADDNSDEWRLSMRAISAEDAVNYALEHHAILMEERRVLDVDIARYEDFLRRFNPTQVENRAA